MVPGCPDNEQVLGRGREHQARDRMISDDLRMHGDVRILLPPAGERF
jgi:hypothetical protein